MRCLACDKRLSDFEATRKRAGTNDYLDLCNSCFKPIQQDINVEVNYALFNAADADDDEYESTGDDE